MASSCWRKELNKRDLVIYVKYDPMFDSVRTDPRFVALMRRLNMPGS